MMRGRDHWAIAVRRPDQTVHLESHDIDSVVRRFPFLGRPGLRGVIALGQAVWRETRMSISELLRHDSPRLRDDQDLRARALTPMAEATLHLPVEIGGYTDFYSSKEHATNVGTMFRDPKNALPIPS